MVAPRVTALAVALVAVVLAGCEPSGRAEPTIEPSAPPPPSVTNTLAGPGCAAYLKKYAEGPASPDELADKSLASAIESHPQLTTLADAISGGLNPRVNLTRELDGGEFTAFAPTDEAFAKLPKETLAALEAPKSSEALTDLLLFHLVVGERNPGSLAGTLETRGGAELKVTSEGDRIRVGGQANVVCGGIQAANATLYLIDTVLVPPN
jgi:uncharacterized surface protein with fasciclin (FAS1) repeats